MNRAFKSVRIRLSGFQNLEYPIELTTPWPWSLGMMEKEYGLARSKCSMGCNAIEVMKHMKTAFEASNNLIKRKEEELQSKDETVGLGTFR